MLALSPSGSRGKAGSGTGSGRRYHAKEPAETRRLNVIAGLELERDER